VIRISLHYGFREEPPAETFGWSHRVATGAVAYEVSLTEKDGEDAEAYAIMQRAVAELHALERLPQYGGKS
jgi:hypothetical protein